MLKKGTLLIILTLALPLAAFANSVDFSSSLSTLTASSSGIVATSTLVAVDGLNGGGLVIGNLGVVNFATGGLLGTLGNTTLFNGGGSFTISTNGTNGLGNGIVFSGIFSQPVVWTQTAPNIYALYGVLEGAIFGNLTSGVSMTLMFNTGNSVMGSSDTIINQVPESSTMSMIGICLIALAGAFWKKVSTRQTQLSY